MICLGIESSCDETAVALVRDGRLLNATLASQANLHAIFGGVVPELASREHLRFIGPLFDELLQKTGLKPGNLDCVAVARGPGLLGSLLTGVAFAKGLALALGIPLVGVNHLHAHLLACGLGHKLVFPALGLVVSGGHTELYRMENPARFARLGRTLDDAVGEAFDKVGHSLGLPYPAGKAIEHLARQATLPAEKLPRPYLDNDNLNFSFSGLKTAAILRAKELGLTARPGTELAAFCLGFNESIADTLAIKTERALKREPDLDCLYLAGGVAANGLVRQRLAELMTKRGGRLYVPDVSLCADNAAMVAYAGWLLLQFGYAHDLALESIPRGRKIPLDYVQWPKQS